MNYFHILGSGVRNLYKYVNIYCGGKPELKEGDVFRTYVPLAADEFGNVNRYKLTERQQIILDIIKENSKVQYDNLAEMLNVSSATVKREIQEIKKKVDLKYDKKNAAWLLNL